MSHGQDCDLIDFPVSPDWLAYYHARGLTCRAPVPEPHPMSENAVYQIEARFRDLEDEIKVLRRTNQNLQAKLAEKRLELGQSQRSAAPSTGVKGVEL